MADVVASTVDSVLEERKEEERRFEKQRRRQQRAQEPAHLREVSGSFQEVILNEFERHV